MSSSLSSLSSLSSSSLICLARAAALGPGGRPEGFKELTQTLRFYCFVVFVVVALAFASVFAMVFVVVVVTV